jgi:lycopene beta-cyclase
MSGLSLYWHIRKAGLSDLRVLILEKEDKRTNDRTWCFWENGKGQFDEIVYHSWDKITVKADPGRSLEIDLGTFRYKMIRGIDLYTHIHTLIQSDPNVWYLKEPVEQILPFGSHVEIRTPKMTYTAPLVFDSIHRNLKKSKNRHHLQQHFFGYFLEFENDVLNPTLPDLMNFEIPQEGECRFIYTLPFSSRKALIEYTIFSENLLEKSIYKHNLEAFIQENYKGVGYKISDTEFGVIPMSDEPINQQPSAGIIRIGTAGGYTNPATGFTFTNTQAQLSKMVTSYAKSGIWKPPSNPLWHRRFPLYYAVLLNVLKFKRMAAPDLFYLLYARNPVDRVFRFLDGNTQFKEEVKLMWTTHVPAFLKATIDVVIKRLLP